MLSPFDPTDDKERLEQKFENFFGEYSAEIRRKLMTKNMEVPQSLYDVYYIKVKNEMLSRNVPTVKEGHLEETGEVFRKDNVKNNIEKIIDIETNSEVFRENMLARQNLQKNVDNLEKVSNDIRKDLLSKNKGTALDLEDASNKFRKDNLAKNKENASANSDNLLSSSAYREKMLGKNVESKQDVEELSKDFRTDDLAKNSGNNSDLEKDSAQHRKDDLARNKSQSSDLEKNSTQFRGDGLAKNKSKTSSLEQDSEQYRKDDLAKNIAKGGAETDERDMVESSAEFRDDDLARNHSKNSNLETDSTDFRKDDLARNHPKNTDLETESKKFRDSDLAKNVEGKKNTDIEDDGAGYRENAIAKNIPIDSNLEQSSEQYRKDDIAKNKEVKSNLEVDSSQYRDSDLSKNEKANTDLEVDSEPFRKDDLSKNEVINTNLEESSESFRKDDLSKNEAINSDLEGSSESFRNDDLSKNETIDSDLEADSETFRSDDLSKNEDINSDLDVDSEPFRKDDLSKNEDINSDLDADSESFRNDDLSKNEDINSDLEADSESFRNDDLAHNSPVESDLEVDSEPFRNDDLAHNSPVESDLEVDSEPFRNDDLAHNNPVSTDLGSDSIPFRNDDISRNNPIVTNLETDSASYRGDDLSKNLTSNYDIDKHVNMYGAGSTDKSERDYNVDRNVPKGTDLLTDTDGFRNQNLSRNPPGGLFGVNINALGTSQFIGVSRVWVQGLLFRNLQLMRNNKKGEYEGDFGDPNLGYIGGDSIASVMMSRNKYYPTVGNSYQSNSENYSLLRDTLNPTFKTDVQIKTSHGNETEIRSVGLSTLPISIPYEYSSLEPSPIYNNLARMFQGVDESISTGLIFGLSKVTKKVRSGNLGALGGDSKKGEFDYEESIGSGADLGGRLTVLIRNYLTHANPFAVRQPGSEGKENASTNVQGQSGVPYGEAIKTFEDVSGDGLKGLLEYYDIFNYERYTQNSLSLLAPGIDYLKGDIEYLYQGEKKKRVENGKVQNNVFKTVVGNPLENGDTEFITGKKGIIKIMNDIRNDSRIQFRENYIGIQGSGVGTAQGEASKPKSYMVGFNPVTGNVKKSRQKFTITNPYAPEGAGRLVFYIRNYSIPIGEGGVMYFPPYIQSFQNSDSANWNSINFLGRPEPIYTYNNSTRDGSLTFFILTDFAQTVELGRSGQFSNDDSDPMKKLYFNSGGARFTNKPVSSEVGLKQLNLQKLALDAQRVKKQEEIAERSKKSSETNSKEGSRLDNGDKNFTKALGGNVGSFFGKSSKTSATDDVAVSNDLTEYYRQEAELAAAELQYLDVNYSEANKQGVNVYSQITTIGNDIVEGAKSTVLRNTADRLDEMKSGLMFQPAFFSGDLVDFKKRAEFVAKLTRPAKNDSAAGFSFTKPPVCHLRLGDWFDHDVIINSVSYDYANAPWTIGGEKTQPMWVSVNINFNIVGPAGKEGGVPLTSTDVEGFFGTSFVPGTGNDVLSFLKDNVSSALSNASAAALKQLEKDKQGGFDDGNAGNTQLGANTSASNVPSPQGGDDVDFINNRTEYL